MKKSLLFITLICSSVLMNAQSLNDITLLIYQKKFDLAKTSIDKLMLDPKQAANAEALFLKGSIYNETSKDAKLAPLDAYKFKVVAFETYQKYLLADKKATSMKDQGNFPFLELYANLIDLGAIQFNNKTFADAFNSFVKAQEVEDLIFEKGYTYTQLKLNKLDTGLVLNTAASAVNKGDSVTAVKYYTRLIDAGVSSKDNESVYDLVARYYMDRADAQNFKAVVTKAQKIYPGNAYWNGLEMDFLAKNDKPGLFAKYEENYTKNPNDNTNTLNYGIELYNYYYDNIKGKKDSASSVKIINVLKTAVKNGDESNNANILLANHLYNTALGYEDKAEEIKSLKPADVKRKKDLKSLAVSVLNDLIPYAENSVKFFKALPTLKNGQKSNYRSAAGYLAEAYKATKNVVKAAEYDKLMNSLTTK